MRLNEPDTQLPLVSCSASELGLPLPARVTPAVVLLRPTKTDTLWPEAVIARGGGWLSLLCDDGEAFALLPPLPTYTETRDLSLAYVGHHESGVWKRSGEGEEAR